jgi:opacity protein-like surface antigen
MLKKALVVSMLLWLCPAAYAGITGLGFGVHGGIVSGYNNKTLEQSVKDAFQSFTDFSLSKNMTGIGVHVKVGTLRIIDLDGSLDYAWKKQTVYQDIDLTYSIFSATASVRKSIPVGPLGPYIGAGLGLYRSAYSISSGSVMVVLPSDETKVGYHVKGGLELNIPMFPLTPFAEFRYSQIQASGEAVKYQQIFAGLTLNLP